jgi:hypothetical protein
LLYPFFHTWNLHPMCSNDSILQIFQFPTYWICALLCLFFIFSSFCWIKGVTNVFLFVVFLSVVAP